MRVSIRSNAVSLPDTHHFSKGLSKLTELLRAASLGFMVLHAPHTLAEERVLPITLNKSRIVPLPASTEKITVGNPAIADIQLLDPTHLYVVGQRLGSTNVSLWNGRNHYYDTLELEVTHDLDGIKAKLHELYPKEHPKVYSSQGAVVLSGEISSLDTMNDILAIAKTFVRKEEKTQQAPASGNPAPSPSSQDSDVINLMQVGGPQQVMLGVTVAEINRSLARRLKIDFSALGGSGDFSAGAVRGDALVSALTDALTVAPGIINPAGLFMRFIGRDVAVKSVINAAKDNGLAKILAEPTLTTISGQDAEFLSGGEFPIPVPQTLNGLGSGSITIQFKEFGVGLKFLPVVLDSGHINLKLNISVSELSDANSVVVPVGNTQKTFAIPALTKRSAIASLELGDGQTLGIAGLISDRVRDNVSKFPGLGDVPILGQLFTSQEFLKDQTELVIFVTPTLAQAIEPDKIRLPTDHFVEPDDIDFYWMGRIEGRHATPRPHGVSLAARRGGMTGHFGQRP